MALPTIKKVRWKGEAYRRLDLVSESLPRLQREYRRYRGRRERTAVYDYLDAVYDFVRGFERSTDCMRVARAMAKGAGHPKRSDQDEFGLIIIATSDTDPQTRWKWAQCLRRAAENEVPAGQLLIFISGEGGINDCAEGAD